MTTNENEPVIGYSGFDEFEECFEYNEDACFIAGTEAAADRFMQDAFTMPDYRIVAVTLSQIMSDYGCSGGEFAMEKRSVQSVSPRRHRGGHSLRDGARSIRP